MEHIQNDMESELNDLCSDLNNTSINCPIGNRIALTESFKVTQQFLLFAFKDIDNQDRVDSIEIDNQINQHIMEVSLRFTDYNQRNIFDCYPYLHHYFNLFNSGMSEKIMFDNESYNNFHLLLLIHFIDSTIISILSTRI